MDGYYEVIETRDTESWCAFEEIELSMSRAAAKGYRLAQPLQLVMEDRGNKPRLYHVIATMVKREPK